MNFLVDAQLPRRLARRLGEAGHDALHTLDLPSGNRTPDDQINMIADADRRIMVTKDVDFVDSFLVNRTPRKLLLVSTGNIANRELEMLITGHLAAIVTAFQTYDFIELTRTALVVHE